MTYDGNRISDQLRSSNIGNLLRRSRLDELPQLYNILLGEMSFVGPRPLLPVDQPQWQNSRLVVRPGLTGWAQVNGGRDISPEDKAALDIWYIVNASLWLDISILLRTLVMLVLGERVNRERRTSRALNAGKNKDKMDREELAYPVVELGSRRVGRWRARGALKAQATGRFEGRRPQRSIVKIAGRKEPSS